MWFWESRYPPRLAYIGNPPPSGPAIERVDDIIALNWDGIGDGASVPVGGALHGITTTMATVGELDDPSTDRFVATGHHAGVNDGQLGNGTRFNSSLPTPVILPWENDAWR